MPRASKERASEYPIVLPLVTIRRTGPDGETIEEIDGGESLNQAIDEVRKHLRPPSDRTLNLVINH